ncbi:MGH1-like glycoside hydrolase domain-containing protein [Agaribacter flavus]|uniref:mannosyl-oligosaccharide glucosidase n=1 Tax=Agaribacter flavus TaxID=1902781 RepID=A0ABV7FN75_9ALTE
MSERSTESTPEFSHLLAQTKEKQRLEQHQNASNQWKKWGPYLSERQWGTVREDYSANGNAWDYLPHDHARSRAYRWGEDGIAGFSDFRQRICLSLALWNGQDPILKERLFGLANEQGNHGEDVKELYYYLDASPSHSYLKMLYKYPQAAYPYAELVEKNRHLSKQEKEFELLDTNVFDDNAYFDVFVEYAQAAPEDVLMRIKVHNRGSKAAKIHVLPQLTLRNTWAWTKNMEKPSCIQDTENSIRITHPDLGEYYFYTENCDHLLFTDNETNTQKLFNKPNDASYVKDAFHEFIVNKRKDSVNPSNSGTKAAALHERTVPAQDHIEIYARISKKAHAEPFAGFVDIIAERKQDTDTFYDALQENMASEQRLVQRQALSGLIWSKQFYCFDVHRWLKGDETQPIPEQHREHIRNGEWKHLYNADIISMPDKWEYPWYAVWDLAFHCIPFALIDPDFAKRQMLLFTREWYMHPNGQIPAYEWNFSDVNPPVHAWGAWRVYQIDRKQKGKGDRVFLESTFHKLMLNFTWWVNRKDNDGLNIFQGGFLGLDNIGVFDRSKPLPTGGYINQADGTSWMAMYSLNLMRIALELAIENPVYEDIASKFFEHFLHIAGAMTNIGDSDISLWDEEDKFFYDELRLPSGELIPLRVRSMVGLIPLFAVEVLDAEHINRFPGFKKRLDWLLEHRPELNKLVPRWSEPGKKDRRMFALTSERKIRSILQRVLNEEEFLSDYGIRGMSKAHEASPYVFKCSGVEVNVAYEPAESQSGLFGGNSNWRGPIWFPLNYLLIESLQKFHHYFGDEFTVECPVGSGQQLNLNQVAEFLSERLSQIFLKGEDGARAVYGHRPIMDQDPYFKDHILFYEYFDGDTGRGVGASHQTGWTALVAKLLHPKAKIQ